jgi:hypothetical protein
MKCTFQFLCGWSLRTEVNGVEGKEKSTRYEVRRTRMEGEKVEVLRQGEINNE